MIEAISNVLSFCLWMVLGVCGFFMVVVSVVWVSCPGSLTKNLHRVNAWRYKRQYRQTKRTVRLLQAKLELATDTHSRVMALAELDNAIDLMKYAERMWQDENRTWLSIDQVYETRWDCCTVPG